MCPEFPSKPLKNLLENFKINNRTTVLVHQYSELLKGQKILFCFELDDFGDDLELYSALKATLSQAPDAFRNTIGAMLVISKTDFYTKRFAQNFMFNMSMRGVHFIGHPLMEIVEGYQNLQTWQKSIQLPLEQIAPVLFDQLIERLERQSIKVYKNPKILVLHASQDQTSNTLTLWKSVSQYLEDLNPKVLHVENGTIVDCKGCGFTQCIHYSESHSCFYGGQVVLEILPAIEEADIVIWLLPNYNDAVSAMLTAVINRMTVLYRRKVLHDKSIFAVVVSGNSGGDSVASQLIGALTINKGMFLPQGFLLNTIANDPGTVMSVSGIEEKARLFAERIREMIDYD
jgi:multimeric flavodoxin WrbA